MLTPLRHCFRCLNNTTPLGVQDVDLGNGNDGLSTTDGEEDEVDPIAAER